MAAKEAQVRIKINKLLEEAGWRFFDTPEGKANILLENNVKLTAAALDACGRPNFYLDAKVGKTSSAGNASAIVLTTAR